jgi:hypothetical protein
MTGDQINQKAENYTRDSLDYRPFYRPIMLGDQETSYEISRQISSKAPVSGAADHSFPWPCLCPE